ncbi:M20/M25/M40 family metallo-hydrolase [Micromonospora chokoriensis]|uniref:M20/M25/M40 family metallo-hydrolase n=1 Tax=Micromonospora chokoriensis TaxID=356851 RepID=UPI0004C3BBD5|nr:M20/M25/M40 family metallo-hydrolase [Micromonospora chokoriensis]
MNAEDEVAQLCSELIQIDSINYGDGLGDERLTAEYVAGKLDEVAVACEIIAPPGHGKRTSLLARIPGTGSDRGALLLHGHLDVVPFEEDNWSVPPLSGEFRDGCVWGRGAVDMKNMDAMVLAVVRDMVRTGRRPERDLVLAFVADEEAGGELGAHWLVENRREWFEDCTDAISEVGGFSYTIGDNLRLYLVQTAEKGLSWMQIRARGVAGHGSMLPDHNAVAELAEAVARVGRHRFPIHLTDTTRSLLRDLSSFLELPFDAKDPEPLLAQLGPMARLIGASIANTANPTFMRAGQKVNVIPGEAVAMIDGRFLPGQEEEFDRVMGELLGDAFECEPIVRRPAVETSFDGPLIKDISEALTAEDPIAHPLPYMLSAGTDAKSFDRLGMKCVGFTPLRLPSDMDFSSLFHGVDERVPVDSLQFGVRVLDRLLSGRS